MTEIITDATVRTRVAVVEVERLLVTRAEAARLLGLSKGTFDRLRRTEPLLEPRLDELGGRGKGRTMRWSVRRLREWADSPAGTHARSRRVRRRRGSAEGDVSP